MSEDAAVFSSVDSALDAMLAGRRWLVTETVLVGAARMADRLRARGAERSFLIAGTPGTGDPPAEDAVADFECLDLPTADSMMGSVRLAMAALRDLPEDVIARVDAWDPDHTARVVEPIFGDGGPVAGREVFGARWPAWQALEDKTTIDAVWDALGVERAPSRIVPVTREALTEAAGALDQGAGTVWAADMREGFHGGAAGTHLVRGAASAERALNALSRESDTARVMPFLEGLPCSIHGLVFPDHVVTTRPAELLTLRYADGSGFLYCRSASSWWPGDAAVESLRALAVRTGDHLRQTLGYRGAFTIDGVWTHEGFRPTELNPRVGAALGQVMPGIDGFFVQLALVEGVDLGVDPRELERALRARSRERWVASSMVMTKTVFTETRERRLRWLADDWVEVAPADPFDATLRYGPAGTGGILFLTHERESLSFGPSLGRKTAAFVRWVDRNLGAGIGDVEPAPWPV